MQGLNWGGLLRAGTKQQLVPPGAQQRMLPPPGGPENETGSHRGPQNSRLLWRGGGVSTGTSGGGGVMVVGWDVTRPHTGGIAGLRVRPNPPGVHQPPGTQVKLGYGRPQCRDCWDLLETSSTLLAPRGTEQYDPGTSWKPAGI